MHNPWRILLPLSTAAALSLLGDAALYSVLPSHTTAAGITLGSVGLILGSNRLVRIFLNSPVGALYDRVGRRQPFIIAMGLGVVSTVTYALAQGFWPLFLARLAWGIAWALLIVGSYNILLDISTPADRGRITGAYHALTFMGGAAGMLLGGFLTDLLDYQTTFLLCAAGTGLGMLVALAFLPETGQPRSNSHPGPAGNSVSHLRDGPLLNVSYVNFANMFVGNGVLMSTIGLLLKKCFDDPACFGPLVLGVASLTGIFLSSRTLLAIVFNLLSGYGSDRLGRRGPIALAGLLVLLGGFLLLVWRAHIWAVVLGFVLAAMGGGVVSTTLTALVGDLVAGKGQGMAIGLFTTAGDIGAASGPIVGYFIAARWDLSWTYLTCVLFIGSACVILARLKIQRPSGTPIHHQTFLKHESLE